MKKHSFYFISAFVLLSLQNCKEKIDNKPLPFIGERLGVTPAGDTIYPTIRPFAFVNQNGETVTNADFKDKIYIADFFFTHCPTICPKVTAQMLRIHDRFKDSSHVALLSHSIDPRHDSINVLHDYASKLGVVPPKWNFVTGNRDSIYAITSDYFSIAIETPGIQGGFDHSGRIILVDKNKHVRSFCDGTDAKAVDKFMLDIEKLLKE